MKYIILSVLILSIYISSNAQGKFKFEKESHDFGTFKEEAGTQRYSFIFTNTGNRPIIIKHADIACGCTTLKWDKKPVAPNQKGKLTVIYTPDNRPGNFNKKITIISNASPKLKYLKIKGMVIPKKRTLTDNYPIIIGNLRLRSDHISMLKIYNTEIKTDSLPVYNNTKKTIKPILSNIPKYCKIRIEPNILAANTGGDIIVEYNAKEKNDFGKVADFFNLKIGKTIRKIKLSAHIKEDFRKLSAKEKSLAPKIYVKNRVFNFGNKKSGELIKAKFEITNNGKKDLIIRKIETKDKSIKIISKPQKIGSKETGFIEIEYLPKNKKGRLNKFIKVISNSIYNTEYRLRISGSIL